MTPSMSVRLASSAHFSADRTGALAGRVGAAVGVIEPLSMSDSVVASAVTPTALRSLNSLAAGAVVAVSAVTARSTL